MAERFATPISSLAWTCCARAKRMSLAASLKSFMSEMSSRTQTVDLVRMACASSAIQGTEHA
eukprot:5527677-Heterocapsa_arctica.AAC.1